MKELTEYQKGFIDGIEGLTKIINEKLKDHGIRWASTSRKEIVKYLKTGKWSRK